MKLFYNTTSNLLLSLTIIFGLSLSATAQQLTISPRSSMVLNGNVSLVVNNASLKNDGAFVAGGSTVSFSGHNDTLVSYVTGSNATTFNNLTVSKKAYGVALKSAVIVTNVLEVNDGNLYTDSNLTLRSDANLTARVAEVASESKIIGKANVERYIPGRRSWRLLTAPVTSSNTILNSWQNKGIYAAGLGLLVTGPNPTGITGNGLDVSGYNNISMKGFNYSTQSFVNIANTKIAISQGSKGSADNTGYFVFVRGDRTPGNTIYGNMNATTINSIGTLQTGMQVFTATTAAGKYTLVGNPYASPVDFNKVSKKNLVNRMYVWDPALNQVGGYVMMDDLNNDGVFVKSIVGSSQSKEIQSSQAFFVQTKKEGPASITFEESDKSGSNNKANFRPVTANTPAAAGTGQIITTLNLLNSDNSTTLADGVIAEFDNLYDAGIDLDDAMKFTNSNENLAIVRNNNTLVAERRPALSFNDTVYFKLTTTTQRAYQFVFDATGLEQPGMMGFLEDSYLGTSTMVNLSGTTTVNFSINATASSAAANRFRIVFKPAMGVLPVTISSVKAFEKNSNVMVEWKVENELNMVKYDVEKSTDGASFTNINTTNVTGVNNVYNTYNALDVKPVQGANFYRIKCYDKSGAITYSAIVKVTMGKSEAGFSIYPNPVTSNVINLLMNNQPAGLYQVRLSNTVGQVVFVKSIQSNGGNSTEALNTGSKLAAGIYQMEIIGKDNNHNTQKVIVE
jgi:Secretion system C-terminal sorting domain